MDLVKYNTQSAVNPIGFRNTGVICYFNSVLQSLLSCTSFIDKIKEEKLKIDNPNKDNIVLKEFIKLINLYNMFINKSEIKQDGEKRDEIQKMSISLWKSMAITNKQKNSNFSFNGQQCAGEGLNQLLESMEELQGIQNLFMHRYTSNLYCFDCKKWVSKVDNTNNIFIVEPDLRIQQLDEFKDFDKKEHEIFGKLYNAPNLSELNKYLIKQNTYVDKEYKCPKCEKKGEKYKLNYLVMVPEILVVMSKKYDNSMRKQNVFTDFPEKLSFSGNDGNILRYTAVSQIEHSGGLNGGHYWAISKRKDGWYNCNDLSISASQFKPTNNTYIVFYHLE